MSDRGDGTEEPDPDGQQPAPPEDSKPSEATDGPPAADPPATGVEPPPPPSAAEPPPDPTSEVEPPAEAEPPPPPPPPPAAPPGPRSADPDRVDPSTLPPPTIGTAIGPPGPGNRPSPGNQPATSGWYNGPLPIAGLAPRETIGSAIATTAIKALTAVVVFGGVLLLIPFLFIALIAAFAGSAGGDLDDAGRTRTLIAGESNADITLVAVPVEGVILGEDRGGGGLFAPTDLTYGYTIQEDLAELAEDDSVDGIILEVNSPGGTIFGSKAIADGVAAYQDATGKPVVAYVSGISASGGVYAMAGADRIYADHGTLIGSIGVIFGPFVTYNDVRAIDGGILGGGVTTEGGIEFEFLTAGRSKDFGNPYRPFTDEERAVLQVGLDDAYDEFVAHVAKGRGLTEGEIVDGLGALIFGEQQAVSNGLIDGISNRNDSYEQAAVAAGMTDEQTFKVERLDSGGDDFFSLLGGRLTGTDEPSDGATGAGANPLLTSPLCLGSGAIMAYHGDPTLLCLPGQ